MKTEIVARLDPFQRFLYWIEERHDVYKRKEAGRPKPWTDDEVLRSYFFTNPYRENDKVTRWFRQAIREPMRDDPDVLLATVIFRWFNKIQTGEILIDNDLLVNWNKKKALRILGSLRDKGMAVFTGAFMINSPPGRPKLEAVCDRIQNVWRDRSSLMKSWHEEVTMEDMHRVLTQYEGLGGFMAYEVVCDLRHTFYLRGAKDISTWCNPGPGCIRGLYRIAGKEIENKSNATSPPLPPDWLIQMRRLLTKVRRELPHMPRFEMREIEHSLCEFDKYERARLGDGKMKRKYNGGAK